jgi:hypothetical protein
MSSLAAFVKFEIYGTSGRNGCLYGADEGVLMAQKRHEYR